MGAAPRDAASSAHRRNAFHCPKTAWGSGPKRPADAFSTSIPPSSLTRVSRPETLAIRTGNSFRLYSPSTLTGAGHVSTVTVTLFPLWEQRHRRRRPGTGRMQKHGEHRAAVWLGCIGVRGGRAVVGRVFELGDYLLA